MRHEEVEPDRSCSSSEPRLQPHWYVAIFITILIGLSLGSVFFLGSVSSEDFHGIFVLAMAISFILTYGIRQRIERGRSDVCGGASIVLGILVVAGAVNAPFLPLVLIGLGTEIGWSQAFRVIVIGYALIIAFVIALTTILAWLNNKGPVEVLKDALQRIGMRRD